MALNDWKCTGSSLHGLVAVEPIAGGAALLAFVEVSRLHRRRTAVGIEHLDVQGMDAAAEAFRVEFKHAVHGGCCLSALLAVEPVAACRAFRAASRVEEVGGVDRAPLVPCIERLDVQGVQSALGQRADVELHGCFACGCAVIDDGVAGIEPVAVAVGRLSPCRAYQSKEHDETY